MTTCELISLLREKVGDIVVEDGVSLSKFTKYGTGGKAFAVVYPDSASTLRDTANALDGVIDYFVIGNGSNLLVSDKGYNGVIISTLKVNEITFKSNYLLAESGALISSVIREMQYNSFGGLEFATGIPATVGGAVAMNAGCYNRSISDCVKYVVTNKGVYNKENCNFSYRSSRFLQGETIIKVCFECDVTDPDVLEEKLNQYRSFRKNPRGKNCGSVFKNDGYFAGKVIDECGLKGHRVGGAKISSEHANFIVADQNATSTDIYNLIKSIKEKVLFKKGITLLEELIYLGEF